MYEILFSVHVTNEVMYMRKGCVVLIILSLLLIALSSPASAAAGTELMSMFSIRITVVEDGIEYEWEYDSPNQYEFEQGEHVIKGAPAKEKMEQILQVLSLDEKEDVDQYVKRLKDSQYPNLDRVDIRYMNGEGDLYTWVWEK
jgi:hypothetical protein